MQTITVVAIVDSKIAKEGTVGRKNSPGLRGEVAITIVDRQFFQQWTLGNDFVKLWQIYFRRSQVYGTKIESTRHMHLRRARRKPKYTREETLFEQHSQGVLLVKG